VGVITRVRYNGSAGGPPGSLADYALQYAQENKIKQKQAYSFPK
jgi:hypothetical protein